MPSTGIFEPLLDTGICEAIYPNGTPTGNCGAGLNSNQIDAFTQTATATLALPAVVTVTTAAHIDAYATATLPLVVTITTGEPADFTDVETGYIAFSPHGQLLGPTTGRVVR